MDEDAVEELFAGACFFEVSLHPLKSSEFSVSLAGDGLEEVLNS